MKEKYGKLFFEYIYNKLQLDKVEALFEKQGIRKLENSEFNNELNASKYFYMLNKINIERLSNEEVQFLNTISLADNEFNQKIEEFLLKTYQKVLFSDNAQGYLYYGPESSAYVAPSKAIAIGVYYDKYGFSSGNRLTLEEVDANEDVLCNVLNDIQKNNYDKIMVAFIRYNEFFGKIHDLYDERNVKF